MKRRKPRQPAIVVEGSSSRLPVTVAEVDEWIADYDKNLRDTTERHERCVRKLQWLRAKLEQRAQEAN